MWQQLQCKPLHRSHRSCMASSRDLASQNDPLNLLLVLKVLVVTAKILPCYGNPCIDLSEVWSRLQQGFKYIFQYGIAKSFASALGNETLNIIRFNIHLVMY